jgi:hypothetical protein
MRNFLVGAVCFAFGVFLMLVLSTPYVAILLLLMFVVVGVLCVGLGVFFGRTLLREGADIATNVVQGGFVRELGRAYHNGSRARVEAPEPPQLVASTFTPTSWLPEVEEFDN